MQLSSDTKVLDLIQKYPHTEDYLISLSAKFKALKNPVMRATIAKFATLKDAAGMANLPVDTLMARLDERVRTFDPAKAEAEQKARQELLKGIIRDLHNGTNVADAKKRFNELAKTIDATEIAKLEQALIAEGMPESQITHLCDVHVQVFKDALDEKPKLDVPAGHPVHTFMLENREAEKLCDKLVTALQDPQSGFDIHDLLVRLGEIDKHYLRKEHQLFPLLEKHGITGPSRVMWAIHDETRKMIKTVRELAKQGPSANLVFAARPVAQAIRDMIYKEENILFPMSLEKLSEEEWKKVRHGEEELGYAWITGPEQTTAQVIAAMESQARVTEGKLPLDTGLMSLEQIRLVFTHLPVDISFVDENDEVQFYSGQKERIFPRSPGVIGRKVQNCHPAKSVHVVQEIVAAFKSGTKSNADFWITLGGRFLHIRYFAVRDSAGAYRGCLEVTQDVTEIRQLQGERRILDWQ